MSKFIYTVIPAKAGIHGYALFQQPASGQTLQCKNFGFSSSSPDQTGGIAGGSPAF